VLQESLDTDLKSLQIHPDDFLAHLSAQRLNQQKYTMILREREGMKFQT